MKSWASLMGATIALVASPSTAQRPLQLDDVLSSAARHHPRVQAALARVEVAEQELLGARGAFDPRVSAAASIRAGGYYDLRRVNVEVAQPTSVWGSEIWAGYRYGRGVNDGQYYPSYYSDETLPGGEIRAGIRVPLWRNGPLDQPRAGRRLAEAGLRQAEATRAYTRLAVQQKASEAYWKWVAAGRAWKVHEDVLQLAVVRLDQVQRRIDTGALAPIEGLEARRAVLARRQKVVATHRALQATSLVLGLFHRDRRGDPQPPPASRLPTSVSGASRAVANPRAAFERVVSCNPYLLALRAKVQQLQTKIDLARASFGPRLDASLQVSRDLGTSMAHAEDARLSGTVFEGSVEFSMPLLLRSQRGALGAARAEAQAAREEMRLATDELRTALADAASAYSQAQERLQLARDQRDVIGQLAQAERRRFEMGSSSLLFVNLREQSLAEAAVAEIEAVADTWAADAAWQVLTSCPD